MKDSLKEKIISVALELFQARGYYNVTVDEIVEKAGTSKGGFYYYFKSKDELLLCWLPETEKSYEKWYESRDKEKSSVQLLKEFNRIVLKRIESSYSPEIMAVIYSIQLNMQNKKQLNDSKRTLFNILYHIIQRGQEKGEIKEDSSFREIARNIVIVQRGILYEWAMVDGTFGLESAGCQILDAYVETLRVK